ncbi:proton-coupled folate transporter-like [Uloborus diversus]|uniref:proton-coupled folate transporter-like n=1 Tax=Uloborus diversus TaxID=327109 RepID=UPI00240A709D|nr:proton-coupled folate transporter-like [Uloborus diversus]
MDACTALKLKYITVEPILLLYMLIIFMESNALQELIFIKSCLKIHHPVNISFCDYAKKGNLTDALNEATSWMRYNSAVLSLFTFITSFYVAAWCDKFGRKIPMLIPPIGTAIAAVINCVLSSYIETHVAFFLVSSCVSGLTFGSVGIIAATFGFISDVCGEQSRTKRIVILEAMIFFGGTFGIYAAGAFLNGVDYNNRFNNFSKLFLTEAVIAIIILLYTFIRIHARSTNDFTPITCATLFKLSHVRDSLRTIFRVRDGNGRRNVLLMLLALIFIYLGTVVQFTLSFYYVKTLEWSFTKFSNYNSIQFAVEGIALLFGLPTLFHFFHVPDYFVGIIGILSKVAGFIVFGLSKNDAMIYSCAALFIFSEFPVPVLRSMLSKTVDADEKGRIFAFATILQNLSYFLGSLTLTTIFKNTESFFPGLCFEVAAGLQVLALLIFLFLYATRHDIVTVYEIMENEDGCTDETCHVIAATGAIN